MSKRGKKASSDLLRVVKSYDKGAITRSEILTHIFQELTEENVRESLDVCPSDILLMLRAEAEDLPADGDDTGWEQIRIFGIVTYDRSVTSQQIQEKWEEKKHRLRAGVKVFRSCSEEEHPNASRQS